MKFLPLTARSFLHQLYKKAECKEHPLLYLFLEITRACNLACRHCGSDCSAKTRFTALTTESWVKILEHVADSFSPRPAIVLTGGEPLLHPGFTQLIRKLRDLHFLWGIVSNGYDLDDRAFAILLENTIHSITISLDGMEESHNWLRGKGDSYRRAVRAIRTVSASSIVFRDVVTCVHPRNISELDAIAEVLIANGVNAWRLFRIFPAGRAAGNRELQLSTGETRRMLDWIGERREELRNEGLEVNLSCEGWLPFAIDTKVRNQPFFCRAGINIASVLCDGTVTGCSNNSEQFFEGNVLTDNLAYLWNNKFDKFRDRKWVGTSECGKCNDLKKCQGGSIHLWRDDLLTPEFCYMDCYKDLKIN